LTPLPAAAEGAPLTAQAAENLVAYAKLLGYVRYFHPSGESANLDWDRFAAETIERVESARTPEELAGSLQEIFEPVAPTLRVFPSAEPPPDLAAWRRSIEAASVKTAWVHTGVSHSSNAGAYSSRRLNLPPDEVFGNVLRSAGAQGMRGKTVRLRAAVRVDEKAHTRAQLWLRVDRIDRQRGFFDNMGDRPIVSPTWNVYEIVGAVAEDAATINFGMHMPGVGRAWIDDVSLSIVEAGDDGESLFSEDFEQDRSLMAGLLHASPAGLYDFDPEAEPGFSGKRSGLLSSVVDGEPSEDLFEPLVRELGGGVTCALPRVLAVQEGRTLPVGEAALLSSASLSGNDRSTRLAAVALAWNVFQHFYPYFDVVEVDWRSALREALSESAADPDETAFLWTLRRLVAKLHDGHGSVSHAAEVIRKPPFFWSWIEDQLVITHVLDAYDPEVDVGDVVLQVNGASALEAVRSAEETVSAATDAHRRLRALRTLLSGPPDSELRLQVRTENGRDRTAIVRRTVPPGEYEEQTAPKPWRELEPGFLYVALFRITQDEFDELLPRLAAAEKLVFDLRGYPRVRPTTIGHLIDEAVTSPRMYIPRTSSPDREGVEFVFSNWSIEPSQPRFQGRIAFLTDERAISYAETYLSIVESYDLAEIVGSPTAGTNGNVNPITLPGGYRVVWTGMQVLKRDGARHHGVGVLPTAPIRPTLAGVRSGRDEVLERAIEILGRPE
jgi:C-terminal processing protease CtpA/Prc